ncbi:MAG TPA: ribosome biogenesis GTPase Der [Acidimicrobiales bacterium]|nr:ribosome biogenesis GTPase Der [Acidimicrobiales bacterium]
MSAAKPSVVAVVGRPNVGKSTLVNRILGRREAIVEERPGVTRDRKEVAAEWAGHEFLVVDTGGWLNSDHPLDRQVSAQAERAMSEADVVLFVVDGVVQPTEEDQSVARLLQRSDKAVVLAANKVDAETREADAWAFSRLGLGHPWPVSALHGRGTGDLLDEIVRHLGDVPDQEEPPDDLASDQVGTEPSAPRVAIVGRPNVGKSTLFNRLIGDDRSVVHDMPGTTRDAIDTLVETDAGPVRFVDTAGMRRKSRVGQGAEYYSLVRALRAIDEADAAVVVIDASEGVTHQDQRLAERVDAAGTAVVLALNKWDTLDTEGRARVRAQMVDRLSFLGYAPVLRISAKTGLGVHTLLPALDQAMEAYHRRVPTAELNAAVQQAQAAQRPPHGRVLYATQGATDPPTFTLFTSASLSPTYLRYLERKIRERFDLGPTPVKLRIRPRGD